MGYDNTGTKHSVTQLSWHAIVEHVEDDVKWGPEIFVRESGMLEQQQEFLQIHNNM